MASETHVSHVLVLARMKGADEVILYRWAYEREVAPLALAAWDVAVDAAASSAWYADFWQVRCACGWTSRRVERAAELRVPGWLHLLLGAL